MQAVQFYCCTAQHDSPSHLLQHWPILIAGQEPRRQSTQLQQNVSHLAHLLQHRLVLVAGQEAAVGGVPLNGLPAGRTDTRRQDWLAECPEAARLRSKQRAVGSSGLPAQQRAQHGQ